MLYAAVLFLSLASDEKKQKEEEEEKTSRQKIYLPRSNRHWSTSQSERREQK